MKITLIFHYEHYEDHNVIFYKSSIFNTEFSEIDLAAKFFN
jgi:hypothetical protein